MEIAKLVEFVNNVEKTLLSEKLAEEEMGDILFLYFDGGSRHLAIKGVTIDLSTIKSHLLSDAHDPFNRQALTIDQVKPDLELKEKIRLWRAQRKHQSQTLASDTMDTTL
ncbi:ubiquitin conjugation factor E4 A [Batrachochytrium salamandrivorans]|nr:ubiquitin conjugation factor E4 A [Batrachochytrium salamandrivorans]